MNSGEARGSLKVADGEFWVHKGGSGGLQHEGGLDKFNLIDTFILNADLNKIFLVKVLKVLVISDGFPGIPDVI